MVHPAPNGLVGDRDATFRQRILDVAKAQGKPEIEPARLLDDFRREAVPFVVIFVILMATEPPGRPQARTAVTMPVEMLFAHLKRILWHDCGCEKGASTNSYLPPPLIGGRRRSNVMINVAYRRKTHGEDLSFILPRAPLEAFRTALLISGSSRLVHTEPFRAEPE
jgi:hypothetical protein